VAEPAAGAGAVPAAAAFSVAGLAAVANAKTAFSLRLRLFSPSGGIVGALDLRGACTAEVSAFKQALLVRRGFAVGPLLGRTAALAVIGRT
jgi:hypothetical protein